MKNPWKILIIEDDALIAEIYQRQFEMAGFQVETALNGQEGFYRIFKSRPDAILLDLLLPGMNGIEIIKKFRVQRQFESLPIIVLSNAYLTEIGAEAARAGATRVFNKAAVVPKEIIDAVQEALCGSIERQYSSEPSTTAAAGTFRLSLDSDPMLPTETLLAEPEGANAESAPAPELPVSALDDPAVSLEPSVAPPLTPLEAEIDGAGKDAGQRIALHAVVLEEFISSSAGRVDQMRQVLRSLQSAEGRLVRVEALIDLARIAHNLSANASIVGLQYLAHLSAAVEALIWALFDNPSELGSSTLRSIAKAIDTISRLVTCGANHKLKELNQFNVLVLDDEEIARRCVTQALDRVKLSYVAVARPEIALELLCENAFDLIITDVKMDGMTGFQLCTELRKMPRHAHTPVIFVSGLNDFHSKVVSTTCGGDDFIVKPFVPMELGLRAFLHLIAAHLDSQATSDPEPVAPAPAAPTPPSPPSTLDPAAHRVWHAQNRGL